MDVDVGLCLCLRRYFLKLLLLVDDLSMPKTSRCVYSILFNKRCNSLAFSGKEKYTRLPSPIEYLCSAPNCCIVKSLFQDTKPMLKARVCYVCLVGLACCHRKCMKLPVAMTLHVCCHLSPFCDTARGDRTESPVRVLYMYLTCRLLPAILVVFGPHSNSLKARIMTMTHLTAWMHACTVAVTLH